MLLGTDFEVLSEYPLWTYGEDNKPVLILNTFDDINVIRYWPMGKKNHHFYDIPIEKPITVFMPFGTFFFTTQEECARFAKQIDTQEGKQTVLENSFESSRKNKTIVKMRCKDEIKNGIYSVKALDDLICAYDLFQMRYINENNGIEEVRNVTSENIIGKYIGEYMNMYNFTERHNLKFERVLFELYKEGNNLYINHIFISAGSYYAFTDILLNSRIMNYPICSSPLDANRLQITLKYGGYSAMSMQSSQQMLSNIKETKARKERRKKLAINIAKFAWKHKHEIIMGIKTLAAM